MSIEQPTSVWQGSGRTAGDIAHQIMARWGKDAVKEYDPYKNCFTFNGWRERGYRVKKGEKALRTFTFIPGIETTKDKEGNEKKSSHSYLKGVCLFFIRQVEPIKKQEVTA